MESSTITKFNVFRRKCGLISKQFDTPLAKMEGMRFGLLFVLLAQVIESP